MQDDDTTHGPLAGFTVGVTAARRAEELATLLKRRGAAVQHAPPCGSSRSPTTANSSTQPRS